MTQNYSIGFLCVILIFCLTGVSMADETPSYLVYIQGGEASIADGTDGMMELTVRDVVSHFHLSEKEYGILIPIDTLTSLSYPLNAAVVFSDTLEESTSMVEISNLTISDGNKVLTLQVRPLEFYEGEKLEGLNKDTHDLDGTDLKAITFTGIFVEVPGTSLENGSDPECVRRCHERYPEGNGCWKQCIYR